MENPTALVTGASRGIGAEVARRLAEHGLRVVVTARDADRAVEVARALPGSGHEGHALDVTVPDTVNAVVDALDRGGLDVLVNNAAAYVDWAETGLSADLDAARRVMETNLFGPWLVAQAAVPLLRRSAHPRLVNVSSGGGSHGDEAFGLTTRSGAAASYGISKAALLALTSTLAAELADSAVLVNAVCPGLTATFEGAEQMGARPVAEGAAGIVWAATLPDDGPSGGFFRDGLPLPW
ncbi:SDR family NAD(P)-dependent oxidoreductase [Phycicoccus flavus]|uniref:SDR family NAD(P)-dependent oxidoreductase n=1 Tax=Phycicoccus flavus TaxID=2502783 RepID=A0A8T6R6T3_9MICO|nr:SDR family NAD(P)-dependent oxidoreductase [Phycicoccus flavus]NHA69687.1 SDR family NAD(P)-dependent oxidoreductase [Phycicoccus flavus]